MSERTRAKKELESFTALESQMNKAMKSFLENFNHINDLTELIRREPHLELTAPIETDNIFFRYIYSGVDEQDVAGINRMILYELWAMNNPFMHDDIVKGKYTLKACELKSLSRVSDIDILIEQIISIGNVLVREYI